jgi:hypothetical protein
MFPPAAEGFGWQKARQRWQVFGVVAEAIFGADVLLAPKIVLPLARKHANLALTAVAQDPWQQAASGKRATWMRLTLADAIGDASRQNGSGGNGLYAVQFPWRVDGGASGTFLALGKACAFSKTTIFVAYENDAWHIVRRIAIDLHVGIWPDRDAARVPQLGGNPAKDRVPP